MLYSIVSMSSCSAYKRLLETYQFEIVKEKFYSLLPTNLVSQIENKTREKYLAANNENERSTPWTEVVLQFEAEIRYYFPLFICI